nr:hypothetical protein [Tanacetum cinerariifolium]
MTGHTIQGWDNDIKTMKKAKKPFSRYLLHLHVVNQDHLPPSPPTQHFREGWKTPKDPDEVLGTLSVHYMSLHYPDYAVKYRAQLEDGSLVTKSGEVEFIVKDGCFCPALSRAMKTMKKGEKCPLTVKPQYAFVDNDREPASGNECVVPSNATIQIMLDFSRKHQDGTMFVNKEDNEVPFKFKIDEEQVINGLDRGVKTMKKGQVAILTIHPKYVFGLTESHQESATVPTNSIVYYDVKLVSFVKKKTHGS